MSGLPSRAYEVPSTLRRELVMYGFLQWRTERVSRAQRACFIPA